MYLFIFWLLCIISLVSLENTNGQDILIESSAVKCSASGGDSEVVHWRPEPLAFTKDKSPIVIGPHEPESTLSEQLHNDINLRLTKKCSKKLLVTLKITDSSQEMTSDAIVIVERVRNEETGRTSKIGHPIAIKIHQSSTLQLYPFKFLYKVNGKLYEEVLHKDNNKEFKGCDDNPLSVNPTCGFETDGTGNKIQSGFCCSCDDQSNNKQTRGGQRCDTPHVNEFLKTSAHCLRFSPFWYGVYEMNQPELFHQVQIQVFKSQETSNGSFTWTKLSDSGNAEMVGPQKPEYTGGTMSLAYRQGTGGIPEELQYINVTHSRLLIPIPIPKGSYKTEDPTPLKGTLAETVLVVPKTMLAPRGAHCDRVGTSHAAFLHQDNPCRLQANSCLLNQPFDLWAQDQGKHGDTSFRYKLSSFGPVFENLPIKMDGDTQGKILMEHKRTGAAYIDVEIPADDLLVLSPGYSALIEHVMTDSSALGAKVIAQIGNGQYVGNRFAVSVIKCSGGLPGSKTEMKTLDPRGSALFRLNLHFPQNIKLNFKATCALVVMNEYSEAIAARQIELSPPDTCICLDACACTCVKESLQCKPLSRENLLAAGVVTLGSSGSATGDGGGSSIDQFKTTSFSTSAFKIVSIIFTPIFILLFLGLLKGVLGLCCRPVGLFWLSGVREMVKDDNAPMKKTDELCFNLTFFFLLPFLALKKCRKKSSSKGSAEPTTSFPEGDKKYFSLADEDLSTSEQPQSSSSGGIDSGGPASVTNSEVSTQGFKSDNSTTANESSSVPISRSTSESSRGGLSMPERKARRFGSWHRTPRNFNNDLTLCDSSLFDFRRPDPHDVDL